VSGPPIIIPSFSCPTTIKWRAEQEESARRKKNQKSKVNGQKAKMGNYEDEHIIDTMLSPSRNTLHVSHP
jgi:hypothetical protein